MNNKEKRVFLNGSYAPWLITLRGEFIKSMVAAGHEVHVCADSVDKDVAQELTGMGATVHQSNLRRTGLSIIADTRYFIGLRRVIKDVNPDIVINYTIKPNVWGGIAARTLGIQSVSMVTGLGLPFIERKGLVRSLVGKLSKGLYRLATSGNSKVVFQNPADRDDFIAAGCLAVEDKACIVNGSGVDTQLYRPQSLPPKPVFLLIARLLVSKGVREYAAAMVILKETHPDCEFLLAGWIDEGMDSIKQHELDTWIEKGMEFLGYLSDVKPAIQRASIFVLPSYREGTPRTVLEAMAMGRPVIATDVPGCRDAVDNGRTGLLVPPRDAKSLSEAMAILAENSELRNSMGTEGRYYCERKYDVHEVNSSLMAFLGL